MKNRLLTVISLLAVLSLITVTSIPAMADDAAALYKSKCQLCHGPDGKGDTPAGKKMGARDFHSPEVQKESDADLFKITKDGKAKMPAFAGKLTDDQIKELVKYIRTLK
jgi:cytochrome c6